MPKEQKKIYKLLKRHISYYLASGIITLTIPVVIYAEEPTATTPVVEAEFDSAFLIGDAQKVDISRFKYGNPVLPGEYNVDIYVNSQWFGKRRLIFKAVDSNKNAATCFTEKNLIEFGVKQDVLNQRTALQNGNGCYKIDEWVENAFYDFDTSRLRVDISIPQVALQKNAQGYVDPSVWDRGINAAFLSYSGSAYKTFNQSNGHSETTNAFMGITAGANLADWQLRHNGQWQWQDTPGINQSKSNYQETSTYLQSDVC